MGLDFYFKDQIKYSYWHVFCPFYSFIFPYAYRQPKPALSQSLGHMHRHTLLFEFLNLSHSYLFIISRRTDCREQQLHMDEL